MKYLIANSLDLWDALPTWRNALIVAIVGTLVILFSPKKSGPSSPAGSYGSQSGASSPQGRNQPAMPSQRQALPSNKAIITNTPPPKPILKIAPSVETGTVVNKEDSLLIPEISEEQQIPKKEDSKTIKPSYKEEDDTDA